MNKYLMTMLITFILMIGISNAQPFYQPVYCQNNPACPTGDSSVCYCESYPGGDQCWVVPCKLNPNNGCNDLDYSSAQECPSLCKMVGTYKAECSYPQNPCGTPPCTIGDTICSGNTVDILGHTTGYRTCIADSKGCAVLSPSITSCSPYWCTQFDSHTASCTVYPTKSCENKCSPQQSKCLFIGTYQYKEICDDWNNDGCYEFPEDVVPPQTLPTIGTTYCQFGCEAISKDNAICNIEPQKCLSACSLGDKMCGGNGNVIFNCQLKKYNDDGTPCYDWLDMDGNSNVTDTCEGFGCTETIKNHATCNNPNTPIPEYNLVTGTFNCTPPTCGEPSHNNPYGLGKAGNFLYGYDIGDYPKIFRYYADNLSYYDSPTLPMCNDTPSIYSWVAGDGTYIYALWSDTNANNIISRINPNSMSCSGIILNNSYYQTGADFLEFDVSDNYIWTVSFYDGNVRRFSKTNGALLNTFSDQSWAKNPSGYYTLHICGSDTFAWITDTKNNRTLRYTTTGQYSSYQLQNHTWDSCDIDSQNMQIYATDFNFAPTYGDWNFLQKYDYGNQVPTQCSPGSKECAGELFVNGHWVHPYKLVCSYINGFWRFPEDLSGGEGTSCVYGCEYNESLGDIACRNSPPVNCTNRDWTCNPGNMGCDNNWIWECKDYYGTNCFTKVNSVPCKNGCANTGGCKVCVDECNVTESKCFIGGYEDWYKQQSIATSTPIIANCSYDVNQGCFLWSTQQIERCVYGCFENTTDDGLTHAYCHTNQTMENYMIPEFVSAVRDMFNLGGSLLGIAFPNEAGKYIFSFGMTLFLVGIITWKSHNAKIGLAFFIILSLGFSLFGWLPLWLSIVYIAIGGLYLMRKLFWSGGGEE